MDNDNKLVTSKIVSYLIVNRTNIILKDFSCILRLALKEKKRQFLKENEDLVKKIDHHAQQLIEVSFYSVFKFSGTIIILSFSGLNSPNYFEL